MTDYRIVVRHVGYWRGQVHKWSTVWPFTGTLATSDYATAIDAIHTLEQGVNYHEQGTAVIGGVWEIALYDQAVGGVPALVTSYFDPETPASWVRYTSVGWNLDSRINDTPLESALDVRWQAGLSATGKPVFFRKWFHSTPQNQAGPPNPDVTSTDEGLLTGVLMDQLAVVAGLGAPMGRGGRIAASTPVIAQFFGNHQMPRGRRRKILTSAQQSSLLQQAINGGIKATSSQGGLA